MAESMDKPPPYSPPEATMYGPPDGLDPKGNSAGGYGPPLGEPNPQFVPPGYHHGPPPPGPYPGPQFAGAPQMGQQFAGAPPMGQNFPNYGSTVYVHQPPPSTQIILVGGCPACRSGVLEDDFTVLGVCLAILFFPLGIICCLAMRQRRCPNCGAVFG